LIDLALDVLDVLQSFLPPGLITEAGGIDDLPDGHRLGGDKHFRAVVTDLLR